ncbi:hypothetical protein C5167_016123 [Papaver somniferum]|nr:hypothetical protein C5167_016123 [Papaver somniferum]
MTLSLTKSINISRRYSSAGHKFDIPTEHTKKKRRDLEKLKAEYFSTVNQKAAVAKDFKDENKYMAESDILKL